MALFNGAIELVVSIAAPSRIVTFMVSNDITSYSKPKIHCSLFPVAMSPTVNWKG
jgi:hypothetical protein